MTQLIENAAATPDAPFGADLAAILGAPGLDLARDEITSWPGYAPTPLVGLPGLAAESGLGWIGYKDESGRFGLGSFKALGGAYAVFRLLQKEISATTGRQITGADLRAGRLADLSQKITVCCATDGNHGRSVAWGARTFGCRCVIYIHATVSLARKAAIESFGAEVRRVAGNYDDSVRQAAADADAHGWFVVSDTSYPGYMDVPREVMQGYVLMADEAIAQLPDGRPPSHIFVQGGVGGVAAAICAHVWRVFGKQRPRFVIVEPDRAACIYRSIEAGRPTAVSGALDTIMAGLACGEVSLLAWDILKHGVDAVMTVEDDAALGLMRRLASGGSGDPPIVAGESAVAGLAGLLAARADPKMAASLDLDAASRVLVFGTEGATDPELYEKIVGRSADDVRQAGAKGTS